MGVQSEVRTQACGGRSGAKQHAGSRAPEPSTHLPLSRPIGQVDLSPHRGRSLCSHSENFGWMVPCFLLRASENASLRSKCKWQGQGEEGQEQLKTAVFPLAGPHTHGCSQCITMITNGFLPRQFPPACKCGLQGVHSRLPASQE